VLAWTRHALLGCASDLSRTGFDHRRWNGLNAYSGAGSMRAEIHIHEPRKSWSM
jgi:hypothetical protein